MSKWLQNKSLRSISLIHHSGDYDSITKSLIFLPFKPSLRSSNAYSGLNSWIKSLVT